MNSIKLPYIPRDCVHNAHMFYLKVANESVQSGLIDHFKKAGIGAVFHYVPLHSSEAGRKLGRFHGEDKFTTIESSRLIRLPMYYSLSIQEVEKVVDVCTNTLSCKYINYTIEGVLMIDDYGR